MKKYSKQREILLNELRGRKDHPTAEELYRAVRDKMPNYSLGTVYRNLNDLSKNGMILKLPMSDGPERYDGCTAPHLHFTCESCGCVYDLKDEEELLALLQSQLQAALFAQAAEISSCYIMFGGICRNCAAAK